MKSETGFDHALYDRFPTAEARPQSEVEELKHIWAAPKGWARLTIVNNNFVGVWYVAAAFLFFLLAGVLALVIRAQLSLPMLGVLPQETYNQFFTMHGTIMMFLFAVPMMEALGVMLLPQMLGARDLPFPRLSAYAFWAYFIGGLAFFCSLFFGLAPDGGWFMYPPLTSTTYSPGINADFWLLGIGFIEISAIAGAIEILVGILKTRAPGMTLARMPLFAWAMLVFAAMILIAFPSVILATLLLEMERALNWPFFDATRGGDPMLWQHLFWFFGHPEVYIIFLPAAGLVSMMVAALSKTELVGYQLIVLALVATGFISFGVWAHHMFTTGMPRLSIAVFSAASMAVSIPAGIQVFSWIATLATGKPTFNTPTLFVIGGLVTFVMGGLTGVMVAMVPFDWQAHDTHFIVAHLHYVLIGGAVFPVIAAFYYWFGMSSDRRLSDKLGRWVFGLMFAGMHITFLPMHLTGLMGMPRRVYTYLPGMQWEWTNFISTVGAFIMGAGVLLLLYDLARNFRFTTEGGAGNTYGGGTLEWLPTGLYSTRSIPVVRSRHPLWDNPDLAREVEEGRHFLPYSPTGRRETLITSPLQAEPQYLAIIMGPSVWPLLAAAFTAGVFLLLTVQAYIPSLICLPLAILCIMRWLWDTDRKVGMDLVDVGAGVTLPTYVTGPSTHGWWAMVCVLVVAGMIFTMAVFGYLFTLGVHPQFWTPPQGRWWALPVVVLYAGAALLVFYGNRLMARENSTSVWSPTAAMLFAAGLVATALATDWFSWQTEGLDPQLTIQGAFSHALLALQGQVVAVVVLMAIYLSARTARGLVTRPRNTTFDLLTLFFLYTCAQGAITAVLIRMVPA